MGVDADLLLESRETGQLVQFFFELLVLERFAAEALAQHRPRRGAAHGRGPDAEDVVGHGGRVGFGDDGPQSGRRWRGEELVGFDETLGAEDLYVGHLFDALEPDRRGGGGVTAAASTLHCDCRATEIHESEISSDVRNDGA